MTRCGGGICRSSHFVIVNVIPKTRIRRTAMTKSNRKAEQNSGCRRGWVDLKVLPTPRRRCWIPAIALIMSASVSASDRMGDSGSGIEPELKRRRLLDAGGPIEDEETARKKMRDAKVYFMSEVSEGHAIVGYDPDNVSAKRGKYVYSHSNALTNLISPMGYFAGQGDLPMMRWLYVNGADTRDDDVDFWFPMYAAAQGAKFDACKWLFAHGAAVDIKRRCISENPGSNGLSPLLGHVLGSSANNRAMGRWLILNGALCQDDDTGVLNTDVLRKYLRGSFSERNVLLEWATEQHQCRKAFIMFLQGTLGIPDYSPQKLLTELTKRNRSEHAVKIILKNTPTDQCQLLWEALHDNPLKLNFCVKKEEFLKRFRNLLV